MKSLKVRQSLSDAVPWKATHGMWPNDMAQVFVQGQLKMRINGRAQMTTFIPPL